MALREFSSVKVGDELPEKLINLTRADLVNYAGVSGDLNPIHWDDDIAKQVGLDTAIAHGMLTMGLGGGYVSEWVGDPGAVTEYNVRFTAVVPVPNDGVGAEIVARVVEHCFDDLDAPPLRVHQEDVPLPYAANLEALSLPGVDKIVKAAKAVCTVKVKPPVAGKCLAPPGLPLACIPNDAPRPPDGAGPPPRS